MDLSSHFSQLHVSEDYKVVDSHSRDRLSELPDSLILEILSLMRMGDVVRTTVLSKRWKNLWITVPCLDFMFDSRRNFICGALAKWKGAKILKFSLELFDTSEVSTSDINLFLFFAFEKQVEELYINLSFWRLFKEDAPSTIDYWLPQRLYSFSSIKKLTLVDCELIIKENVQWNQLKSLTITGEKSLRGDTLNQILSGAPRLEELILYFKKITEDSTILSTSLKVLKFQTFYDTIDRRETVMRIRTPNLSTIQLSGYINDTCLLDVPSLTDATLNIPVIGFGDHFVFEAFNQVFRSIRHVEKLTLSCIRKFLVYAKKEKDMVVEFSNVKYLKLYEVFSSGAKEMLDVLEMFPQLMILILEAHYQDCFDISSRTTTFPSPSLLHLKTLKISWFVHDPTLIPAIEIMLQNAHLLNKMEFRPRYEYNEDQELLLMVEKKVLCMPRSSPTAEVIIIKH